MTASRYGLPTCSISNILDCTFHCDCFAGSLAGGIVKTGRSPTPSVQQWLESLKTIPDSSAPPSGQASQPAPEPEPQVLPISKPNHGMVMVNAVSDSCAMQ